MTVPQDLAALERLIDDDDLSRLEALIGRFNLFDALDIARSETRHSNALAFLLDPVESHGQGQLFLKALLMDLLRLAPADRRPMSPVDLDGADLRGVEVRREWQSIDLLIVCPQPALVVAIENKVDSKEHSDQLSRYQRTVARSFPKTPSLFVFLTLGGVEASRADWVRYTWADVHHVLHRVREAHQNSIGSDVLVFLDHYLNLIGSRFMPDPQIDELCKRIYRNHHRALQLIYEKAGTPASGIAAAVEEEILEDMRWHPFYATADRVDFVPAAWLDWLPSIGLDFKDDPRSWIVARLEVGEDRLSFFVEVRKMSDPSLRTRIIEKLIPKAEEVGFKRRQAGGLTGSYTRVVGRDPLLEWAEEEPPDSSAVRTTVRTLLNAVYPKFQGLEATLKSLTVGGERTSGLP